MKAYRYLCLSKVQNLLVDQQIICVYLRTILMPQISRVSLLVFKLTYRFY
jgi:hypothetical protein